jgi:phenylacetate-CoA ligase
MASSLRRALPTQQQLFDLAPSWAKRVLVNVEATRREWFRRHGDYRALVASYDPAFYRLPLEAQEAFQLAELNRLIAAVRHHVPHYRATLPAGPLGALAELAELPTVEKEQIRRDPFAFVGEQVPRRELWARTTSGSTGTPLTFRLDREATRRQQAAADAMLAAYGCPFGERRARFSGAYVAPYARREPPFWIWIDSYRQLQCSAYHLAPEFFPHYLRAIRRSRVTYGTGYPSSWHLLASYMLEHGVPAPPLRAIITDSEGISLEQQAVIERAFSCPVYQTYGTGEIGQVVWQCRHRRYHILTRAVILELLDDAGRPVGPGQTGQVIATSLTGAGTPFIRYRTGDLATLAEGPCPCGLQSPSLAAIEGRIDDRLLTPDGRWVRLGGHVVRAAVGIRESQIAQVAPDRVVIRVVPEPGFAPASMDEVVAAAHRYLGAGMQVSWLAVERLPRTRSGKLRHVVREL